MKLHAPLLAALAFGVPLSNTLSAQDSIKQVVAGTEAGKLRQFEAVIDRLREELKIPAVSAAIVKNQKILWARGFGYADLENRIPATENTAYHLASLTKTPTVCCTAMAKRWPIVFPMTPACQTNSRFGSSRMYRRVWPR